MFRVWKLNMALDAPSRSHSPQSNSPQANLPRVSVIIPIYNGEADLPDLLNCLRQQTYSAATGLAAEYLLVNNGSSDRTSRLLARLKPPYYCLNETQIQSSYAARNAGIKIAAGDILAFTDADCRPCPDWLTQLVAPFAEPTVGIVAGEITALLGHSLLERYADRHETLSQKHTLAHPFCAYGQTANLAIRRSAFEQVGLFRPYLTTGGDADICWRILRQTHWQIQFAPDAIIQHRHRTTLAELQSQWRRYGRSNRYLHELHGVDLAKELTPQDLLYRWSRWLLKEVPQVGVSGKTLDWLDMLVDTPLSLFCGWARANGQRQAQLLDAAREVAWLAAQPPALSPDQFDAERKFASLSEFGELSPPVSAQCTNSVKITG
jgi:glycosyltransferase involved in cell wall biosynthesis